jgi:hypothetical protein
VEGGGVRNGKFVGNVNTGSLRKACVTTRYQKRFVCTKRGGVGFFERVSTVMHLAVKLF